MHQLNSFVLCGPPEIRSIPQKFHLSVCLWCWWNLAKRLAL